MENYISNRYYCVNLVSAHCCRLTTVCRPPRSSTFCTKRDTNVCQSDDEHSMPLSWIDSASILQETWCLAKSHHQRSSNSARVRSTVLQSHCHHTHAWCRSILCSPKSCGHVQSPLTSCIAVVVLHSVSNITECASRTIDIFTTSSRPIART